MSLLADSETIGAGDGMPDISGTYASLRCGPAAGQMLMHFCFAVESLPRMPIGAGDGIRTRDICLGKATLYH